MELPSSAYTFVNGSSWPIFSAGPAVAVVAAVAAAAEVAAFPPVEVAGAHAAARAAADDVMRNFRRDIRLVIRTSPLASGRTLIRPGSGGDAEAHFPLNTAF